MTTNPTHNPETSGPTDGALMVTVQRGDAVAFRMVFERHVDAIRGYVAARVGPDVGDDLVSETFATAWQLRDRFDLTVTSARPWLYGIATMMVRRHRAAEQRWVDAAEGEARLGAGRGAQVLGSGVGTTISAPLRRAMELLTALERDVLLLTALADASPREVARMLGISHVSARVRLSRARRKLAAALDHDTRGDAT